MASELDALKEMFPGREAQIDQLWTLFGTKDEPFPRSLYISGGPSTGKSSVVASLLNTLKITHAIVNLIECYSSKILFESILNKLMGHKIDPEVGAPFAKCDNLMDFVEQVRRISDLNGSLIVIDQAEELRNMEFNLLPAFLNLQELTGVSISVIFLSEIAFEKYYYRLNIIEPLKLHFPQYTSDELLEILSRDFDYTHKLIENNFKESLDFNLEFYRSYLNIFLPVFYRACRDLRELRYMSRKNFVSYCEPIFKKELTVHDSLALWKRISPVFQSSASVLYLRIATSTNTVPLGNLAHNLELPFYAKYLLIAAYLASYNSVKDDKRMFMKYHGKKTKTQRDIKQKSKVSERLKTQMGPSAFTLDRLLAIFYSILDDKVGFNNHLLVQVSSLVELQLLSLASDPSTLDSRKYKCNVNFQTIQSVSKMVGFNIRKYLSDFSHM